MEAALPLTCTSIGSYSENVAGASGPPSRSEKSRSRPSAVYRGYRELPRPRPSAYEPDRAGVREGEEEVDVDVDAAVAVACTVAARFLLFALVWLMSLELNSTSPSEAEDDVGARRL